MIHHLASALRRTARLATRRPGTALWTALALACALFVVGIAAVAAATVERWAQAHPGRGGNMVVYLGDGVDEARANALVLELRAWHGVERAELVSAAESARRLTRALGSDPGLLDGVDVASLPASVEVELAPGVRDIVAMSPTLRALRGAPGVAEVVVDRANDRGDDRSDDRLAEVLDTARTAAWTGAALFAGLVLIIVLAAVRLGLARSPTEAAVHRLLGASLAFDAIPSALAGALQGAAAAVVAALALAGVLHGHDQLGPIALASPSAAALAGVVALGGLVGLVGGGLAGVARAR